MLFKGKGSQWGNAIIKSMNFSLGKTAAAVEEEVVQLQLVLQKLQQLKLLLLISSICLSNFLSNQKRRRKRGKERDLGLFSFSFALLATDTLFLFLVLVSLLL